MKFRSKSLKRDDGGAPLVAVLIFVIATSLVLGSFLMLSNSALQKNEATRSDDFSAQLESNLESALAESLASYVSATPGSNPLPGASILETSETTVSVTAKVSSVEGTNPWVVIIDEIDKKDVIVSGATLVATPGAGSLGGDQGCVVIEILKGGSSVSCTTSGTQPATVGISFLKMKDYIDCAPDPLSSASSSNQISIICTPFDGSGNGTFYPEDALVLTGSIPNGANHSESAIGSDYGLKVIGSRTVNIYNSVRNYSDTWSGNLRIGGDVLVPSLASNGSRTTNSENYTAVSRTVANGSPKIVTLTLSKAHEVKIGEVIRVTGQPTSSTSSLCSLVTKVTAIGSTTVSYVQGTCDPNPINSTVSLVAIPAICVNYSTASNLQSLTGSLIDCQKREVIDISGSYYYKALQEAVNKSVERVNSINKVVVRAEFPRCTGLTITSASSALGFNASIDSVTTSSTSATFMVSTTSSISNGDWVTIRGFTNVGSGGSTQRWGNLNGEWQVTSREVIQPAGNVSSITISRPSQVPTGQTVSQSGTTARSDGSKGYSEVTLNVQGTGDLVTGMTDPIFVKNLNSNLNDKLWMLSSRSNPQQKSGSPVGVKSQILKFKYTGSISQGAISVTVPSQSPTEGSLVSSFEGNPWQATTPFLTMPAGKYNFEAIESLNNLTSVGGIQKDPYGHVCPARPLISSGNPKPFELKMTAGEFYFDSSVPIIWSINEPKVSVVNGPDSGVVAGKSPMPIKAMKMKATSGRSAKGASIDLELILSQANPYPVGSSMVISYRDTSGASLTIPKTGSANVTDAGQRSLVIRVAKNQLPDMSKVDQSTLEVKGSYFDCDYSQANPSPINSTNGNLSSNLTSASLKAYDQALLESPNGVQLNLSSKVSIRASDGEVRLCPINYVASPKVSISGSFSEDQVNPDQPDICSQDQSIPYIVCFAGSAKLILGGQLLAPRAPVNLSEASSSGSTATVPDMMLLGGVVSKAMTISVSGSRDGSILVQKPIYFQGSGRKFLLKASLQDNQSKKVTKSICAVVSIDDAYGAKPGNKVTISSVVKC